MMLRPALLLAAALLLAGCAQIPVERTYSISASDGARNISAGVTLRPPPKPAATP